MTIYVGPKRKEFIVHKKLLCESADYFKGAFTRDFKEARKGEMYMPEDSPGAFSLYVDWLYRSAIPMANTEDHLHNLYELYFLAEKLCLVVLKDKTMDSIQDMALKYGLKDELITPELITKVLNNTSTRQDRLRSFCVWQMVFVYTKRSLDESEEGEDSESEYESTFAEPGSIVLLKKDMRKVFQIGRNNFRFLDDFVIRLSGQAQVGTNNIIDPRERNEKDADDRCYFHCHKQSFNCRPSQDAEAGGSFVRKVEGNGSV